jgi:hypothetical protein
VEKLRNSLAFVENHLEWTEQKFRFFRGRQEVKVQAPILEIYIDGLPLLALIDPSEADQPERLIPLPSDDPRTSTEQLRELLGAPLPADRRGRAWLLYCQCGDPSCGGLGARITFTHDTVRWSDFGWDSIFEDTPEPVETNVTFVFDRGEYEDLLRNLLTQFSGKPER